MQFLILGALVLIDFALFCLGWKCFRHASWLEAQSEKHVPFTRFDNYLPLRGLWMRNGVVIVLALLGLLVYMLALIDAVLLFFFAGWMFGSH